MRLPRPQIDQCCVHVTHRCQERRFLLKFARDRRQYRRRLFEATRRFPLVRMLNYTITSNHVHLLAWVRRMHDLSDMMHWLQGVAAQDFNRRKDREGSYWRGRFHPTLVQSGRHLSRCLFYMDMNMVRAGVVAHPFEWASGGAADLAGDRQRYCIVDREQLLACLGMPGPWDSFRKWYEATLAELCARPTPSLESFWSSAFAVGEPAWLSGLGGGRMDLTEYIEVVAGGGEETDDLHVLRPPQSVVLRVWRMLQGGKAKKLKSRSSGRPNSSS